MEVYSNNERKTPKELKSAVLREEFKALTGDFLAAFILGQIEYWQLRTKDFDRFIREERERLRSAGIEPGAVEETHGWIYKSADELANELMIDASPRSVRRKIEFLVENGWLLRRRNPKHKWDRTYQYRLSLPKLKKDLEELGYPLARWNLNDVREEQKNTVDSSNGDGDITHVDKSSLCIGHSVQSNEHSVQAIPETTTETLKKEISKEKDYEGNVREEHVKADSSSSRSPEKETLQSWPDGTPPDVLTRLGDRNFGIVAAEVLSANIAKQHTESMSFTPKQLTSYRNQFNNLALEGYEFDVLSRVMQHVADRWLDYPNARIEKSIPYSEAAHKRRGQGPKYIERPEDRVRRVIA